LGTGAGFGWSETRSMVMVPSSGSAGGLSAGRGQGAGEFRLDQASEGDDERGDSDHAGSGSLTGGGSGHEGCEDCED